MIFFQLFYTFFIIGICTFGGGYAMIPLIQDEVVIKNSWVSLDTLTNFIGISESTPGPFAINISTFVGYKVGGVFGAICSTLGVILPSIIIILIIAMILNKFMKNKYVKGMLDGVKPVVLSLITSTTIFLFIKLIFFNNGPLYADFKFDITSLALLIVLFGISFIYKKYKKKSLSPIVILLLSMVFGLIIFI